jgi:hypothetical protein
MPWDDDGNYYENLVRLPPPVRRPEAIPDLPYVQPPYRLSLDYGGAIRAGSFAVEGFTKTGQAKVDIVPLHAAILGAVFQTGVGFLAAPAAVAGGLQVARTAFEVGSGAPVLPALVSAIPAAVNVKGGLPVGWVDDFLGGTGGFNLSTYLPSASTIKSIAEIAAPIASAFLTPSGRSSPAPMAVSYPTYAAAPQYAAPMAPAYTNQLAQPVGMFGSTAALIVQTTRPILFKIAQGLGLRSIPSLPKAIAWIRSMGKYMAPAAIAASLGIGLDELATLITANARKGRRRMNPANVHALRRSARRLESFHKLCARVDSLRSRGRRRAPACPPFRRKK